MTVADVTTETEAGPRVHRFTREEYYQMASAGVVAGRRVELLDGEIIDMAPQNNPHALAIVFVDYALRRIFGSEFTIRVQLPFTVSESSETEPDVAVIAGGPRTHTSHPTNALLVVEVAESSLEFDRTRKARAYAASGVTDYWIVNLAGRSLEVHRDPVADPARGGFRYASVQSVKPPDGISPIAAPHATVAVADLLP